MTRNSNMISPLLDAASAEGVVQSSLSFMRQHMGMEVAYLSEFDGEELVFRAVDAPGFEDVIATGDRMPLDETYCRHILSGELPEMIIDTADEPLAQTIPVTRSLPIKSHVSIPIRRRDGSVYGMFCCLSRAAQPTLNERDLKVMRAFADLSAQHINDTLAVRSEAVALRQMFEEMMVKSAFDIVFQPIMDIAQRRPVGFEALCRFRQEPYRAPNMWFEDAATIGLQPDIEICAIEKALTYLPMLPDDIYISVNASPATVETGLLTDVFTAYPAHRIVLEVTEHAEMLNTELLLDELLILRGMGIRLAIDDAGAGYSGLQQIVLLKPDIIKLDISLTTGLDRDVVRRSLASALVDFADKTNARLVAEGIETEAELSALLDLNVHLGQGYLLGRPADIETAMGWFALEEQKTA